MQNLHLLIDNPNEDYIMYNLQRQQLYVKGLLTEALKVCFLHEPCDREQQRRQTQGSRHQHRGCSAFRRRLPGFLRSLSGDFPQLLSRSAHRVVAWSSRPENNMIVFFVTNFDQFCT